MSGVIKCNALSCSPHAILQRHVGHIRNRRFHDIFICIRMNSYWKLNLHAGKPGKPCDLDLSAADYTIRPFQSIENPTLSHHAAMKTTFSLLSSHSSPSAWTVTFDSVQWTEEGEARWKECAGRTAEADRLAPEPIGVWLSFSLITWEKTETVVLESTAFAF